MVFNIKRFLTPSIGQHNIMKVDVVRGYNPASLDLQGILCNLALAFHRLSENRRRPIQSERYSKHCTNRPRESISGAV